MRILVVEDDEKIRLLPGAVLTAQGYQVSLADRGDDGLEMALEPEVGLVILDLSLPGLDGLDALEKLRQARREKPVLVLTARDALDQNLRPTESCHSNPSPTPRRRSASAHRTPRDPLRRHRRAFRASARARAGRRPRPRDLGRRAAETERTVCDQPRAGSGRCRSHRRSGPGASA